MEKKMYYAVDDGEQEYYFETFTHCYDFIDGGFAEGVKDFKPEDDNEDAPRWSIFPIWMTEEEFNNLED